jgi:hypothetical protein
MRRFFRRGARRNSVPDVPPLLQHANKSMETGDYPGAAMAFEQLAHAAEGRGGPRAPIFYLQAGRARILANQNTAGVQSFKHAFDLFAQRGQFPRLQQTGARVVSEMTERGLTKEAAEVDAWVKALLPTKFTGIFKPPEAPVKKPILPTHCPACGAPVRPDEVEWLDDVTAECVFCGSPVRQE